MIGALWWNPVQGECLTWDRVYQGWHDKAAGTLVTRRPEQRLYGLSAGLVVAELEAFDDVVDAGGEGFSV